MEKLAVIGHPIDHSLSPKIHNKWLTKYNILGNYDKIDILPENLEGFFREDIHRYRGINVTIPYKEAVFPYLDDISQRAKALKAVNTIICKEGRLIGDNTDSYGFWKNIEAKVFSRNKAIVLGAGGAARSIIYALVQEGFKEIIIANRSESKAKILAQEYSLQYCSLFEVEHYFKYCDLFVNTTSLGMVGQAKLHINIKELPITALVTDIVYNPLMTDLLKEASLRGNPIQTGIGMLIYQASLSFQHWFGILPETRYCDPNYLNL